jgi:hypothetical protein
MKSSYDEPHQMFYMINRSYMHLLDYSTSKESYRTFPGYLRVRKSMKPELRNASYSELDCIFIADEREIPCSTRK